MIGECGWTSCLVEEEEEEEVVGRRDWVNIMPVEEEE